MKVAEASGLALDWMVANAERKNIIQVVKGITYVPEYPRIGGVQYHPSTDWAQGGPIIEREGIFSGPHCDIFIAWTGGTRWEGPTQLIAAMRCYVSSKLGDEVEVPEVLHAE